MKGNAGRRVVAARVGILLAVALGALVCFAQSLACSGAGGSSLVGNWDQTTDGGMTVRWFFNSDGTCGEDTKSGNVSTCYSSCEYTYSNGTLTVTTGADSGFGQSLTYLVTLSGDTLTVEAPDGGGGATEFTRIDSNGSTSCL